MPCLLSLHSRITIDAQLGLAVPSWFRARLQSPLAFAACSALLPSQGSLSFAAFLSRLAGTLYSNANPRMRNSSYMLHRVSRLRLLCLRGAGVLTLTVRRSTNASKSHSRTRLRRFDPAGVEETSTKANCPALKSLRTTFSVIESRSATCFIV